MDVESAGEESQLVGVLFDQFGGWLTAAVAGAGFDADEDGCGASLGGLEGGGELEAV